MATITISRQYASGGDEIAARLCELLGYRYFDKRLMAQVAADMGLAESEIVDFSEDNYQVRGFLDRLLGRSETVAHVGAWTEDATGTRTRAVEALDEVATIKLVQGAIQAAHERGRVVIVGRGGQAVLRDRPDVLHVRVVAPLDTRNMRVHEAQKVSLAAAQDIVVTHDRAAAAYLRRFYEIDWADPMHYDLVINTGKLSFEAAAELIAHAVGSLA